VHRVKTVIYGFCLPLWYLETLLVDNKMKNKQITVRTTIYTLMNNIIYYTLPGHSITVIIYTALFNFLMCENNWIYVYFDTSLIYCEFVIDGTLLVDNKMKNKQISVRTIITIVKRRKIETPNKKYIC
jgi:hypothetical protein